MTENNDTDDSGNEYKEVLEWVCWCNALKGEGFYPPDETAKELIKEIEDSGCEIDEKKRAKREMLHDVSYFDAVDFFKDLQHKGFNPVEMAENEIRRARQEGLDLSDIDWEWLEVSRYEMKRDQEAI
jgi:hypothetical protein